MRTASGCIDFGKIYNYGKRKLSESTIEVPKKICYHFIIPVEYAYSTKIGILR